MELSRSKPGSLTSSAMRLPGSPSTISPIISLCASPLILVAHCASITKEIRLDTAVVVLPVYNPARLLVEIATADALSNGHLMLGVGAYQPYEFERFGVDIKANLLAKRLTAANARAPRC